MSRRTLIIGAQAVAVGLLVLVVYATFLRPDDPGTLSGIEAPGGESPRADVRVGDQRDRDEHDVTPNDKNAGATRTARTTTKRTGGAVAGASAFPSGSIGPPAAGTAPPDDQYDDTVATLLAKVTSAGPEDE
jgi:hypothetical protein